jgi:hypothetical protein
MIAMFLLGFLVGLFVGFCVGTIGKMEGPGETLGSNAPRN